MKWVISLLITTEVIPRHNYDLQSETELDLK